MSRIKIIKSDYEFDEATLNRYENQGLTLISVNPVTTHEYPPQMMLGESKQEVVRWTYHFRVPEIRDSAP